MYFALYPCPHLQARSRRQGQTRQKQVSQLLHDVASPNDRIINDGIFINPKTGVSSQIDHIFISTKGIFVIETKNYSGIIYGTDDQREWTQSLNYGKTVNKFYSPVKQNFTHVYLIRTLLNMPLPVFNIVVFVQGNTEYINSEYIYTLPSLKRLLENSPEQISVGEVEKAYRTLSNRINTEITKAQHAASIQTAQYKIANNICPRCSAKLVLRDGKYGQFYGCSNYPTCKFTKEI